MEPGRLFIKASAYTTFSGRRSGVPFFISRLKALLEYTIYLHRGLFEVPIRFVLGEH
jgi:hypothetical protein